MRAQALDLEEATTAVKALHAVICTHGPKGPQGGIGGNLPQRCQRESERVFVHARVGAAERDKGRERRRREETVRGWHVCVCVYVCMCARCVCVCVCVCLCVPVCVHTNVDEGADLPCDTN